MALLYNGIAWLIGGIEIELEIPRVRAPVLFVRFGIAVSHDRKPSAERGRLFREVAAYGARIPIWR